MAHLTKETIQNLEEDLKEMKLTFEEAVRQMLLDEGLWGVMEDEYDIIDIKQGR